MRNTAAGKLLWMPCFRGWIFKMSIREQVEEVDALLQGMDCPIRGIDKTDNRIGRNHPGGEIPGMVPVVVLVQSLILLKAS